MASSPVFIKISEACSPKLSGKEVAIRGWVHRHRTGKGIVFIVLRDETGSMQATVKEDVAKESEDAKSGSSSSGNFFESAKNLFIESSVELYGKVREDPRAPGGWELSVESLKAISVGNPFPITKDQSPEFLMDVRHLWIRSTKITNAMKVKALLLRYLRDFFNERGFTEAHPPILTRSGCEGGSTLFELKYFDDKAYLSQSAQMYLEALIFSLGNVWSLTPSFRAERSRTVRHLAEYWHLEAEAPFFSNEDNMKLQEDMVSYVCNRIGKEHPELLEYFGRDPKDMLAIKPPFERLTYDDVIKRLQKLGFGVKWGDDFGADEEKLLTKDFKAPVFVHNYPAGVKAFYMRKDPKNPKTVLCADMLAPEGHGEIIGGSERIWEEKELLEAIKANKLKKEDYEWYVDLRKYGSVPHSGFGMGLERLLKWILKLDHIRDAIAFPRTINRIYP